MNPIIRIPNTLALLEMTRIRIRIALFGRNYSNIRIFELFVSTLLGTKYLQIDNNIKNIIKYAKQSLRHPPGHHWLAGIYLARSHRESLPDQWPSRLSFLSRPSELIIIQMDLDRYYFPENINLADTRHWKQQNIAMYLPSFKFQYFVCVFIAIKDRTFNWLVTKL